MASGFTPKSLAIAARTSRSLIPNVALRNPVTCATGAVGAGGAAVMLAGGGTASFFGCAAAGLSRLGCGCDCATAAPANEVTTRLKTIQAPTRPSGVPSGVPSFVIFVLLRP
jgi:hypothetical protein